jgi:hypothetical protein
MDNAGGAFAEIVEGRHLSHSDALMRLAATRSDESSSKRLAEPRFSCAAFAS